MNQKKTTVKKISAKKSSVKKTSSKEATVQKNISAKKVDDVNKNVTVTNKSKSSTSIYISFNARLLISIILFFMLIGFSAFFIVKSINTDKKVQVNYRSDEQLTYKVYLKENNFYETNYLEEDMTYVASLIDNIKIDYKDKFNVDRIANLNYHYKIIAKLIITPKDNGDQILFEKSYILFDKSNNIDNTKYYELNENITIDYNKYNQIVNDFKTTYGVDCDSKLYINKVLLTTGKEILYDIDFNNLSENSLVIPLSEKQITISKSIEPSESKSNEKALRMFVGNKSLFICGLLLFIILIIDTVYLLRLVKLLKPKKGRYQKELKRILNEYDRMIVNVNRLPDLSKYDVYKVLSFSELIDVRDNLKNPIAYVKISNEKSCFYVKNESTVYIYYLKNVDL